MAGVDADGCWDSACSKDETNLKVEAVKRRTVWF